MTYELQQNTLCQGCVNNWTIWDDENGEQPHTFETVEEAQAELDDFFNDINTEILNGERDIENDFCIDEFMIVEIPEPIELPDFLEIAA